MRCSTIAVRKCSNPCKIRECEQLSPVIRTISGTHTGLDEYPSFFMAFLSFWELLVYTVFFVLFLLLDFL